MPLAISNQIDIDSSLPNNTETGYRIRQITFAGNKHFDWKQLSQAIGVQAGQPYRKAEMIAGLNQVLAKYRESGFVFASIAPEVTSISADQVHIRLRIDEGKRIRIGQITIEGNHLFSTQPPCSSMTTAIGSSAMRNSSSNSPVSLVSGT